MKLEELVANVLDVPLAQIRPTTGPGTLMAWNSLKHLEMIATIEEVYNVKLTTREIHRLTSVADIRHILQKKAIDAL